MTWHGQTYQALSSKSSPDSGAGRPANSLQSSPKRNRPSATLTRLYTVAICLLLMTPLSGCGLFETKQPPFDPRPTRPCFQWLVAKDQEVYIYDNGSMVARLEAEPYDAVISGWCLLKYNQDLANEVRRLAH